MTLHLPAPDNDPYGNGLGMTAAIRMDALIAALEQCNTGGEALALEADEITRRWARLPAAFVAAGYRACEARRAELAARRQGEAAHPATPDMGE
jgi:hypothetical protein